MCSNIQIRIKDYTKITGTKNKTADFSQTALKIHNDDRKVTKISSLCQFLITNKNP